MKFREAALQTRSPFNGLRSALSEPPAWRFQLAGNVLEVFQLALDSKVWNLHSDGTLKSYGTLLRIVFRKMRGNQHTLVDTLPVYAGYPLDTIQYRNSMPTVPIYLGSEVHVRKITFGKELGIECHIGDHACPQHRQIDDVNAGMCVGLDVVWCISYES